MLLEHPILICYYFLKLWTERKRNLSWKTMLLHTVFLHEIIFFFKKKKGLFLFSEDTLKKKRLIIHSAQTFRLTLGYSLKEFLVKKVDPLLALVFYSVVEFLPPASCHKPKDLPVSRYGKTKYADCSSFSLSHVFKQSWLLASWKGCRRREMMFR